MLPSNQPANSATSSKTSSKPNLTPLEKELAAGAKVSLRPEALLLDLPPLGVEGGKPPRQPLQGITRSVAPKGRLAVLLLTLLLIV